MSKVEEETVVVKAPVVDVRVVPIASIRKNAWNPNVQDGRTYEAERESIRTHGFVVPMTVRPHPTLDGELVSEAGDGWSEDVWQTIDGEHRARAAEDEGFDTVSINNLGPIPDVQAKKLTVILNETNGDADVAMLGKLLADLDAAFEGDRDMLRMALPYSENELAHLLEVGKINWDQFQAENDPIGARLSPTRKFTVFLDFDEDQRKRYDAFVDMLARERGEAFTVEEAVLNSLSVTCQNL